MKRLLISTLKTIILSLYIVFTPFIVSSLIKKGGFIVLAILFFRVLTGLVYRFKKDSEHEGFLLFYTIWIIVFVIILELIKDIEII